MNATGTRRRLAKACVYVGDSERPFLVAESPREVADLVTGATGLVELTLANESDWNGKPAFVRGDRVAAITPPTDPPDHDE